MFAPALTNIVALKKQMAKCLAKSNNLYDAMLDLFEPELTIKQVDPVFKELKTQLIKLVQATQQSKQKPIKNLLEKEGYAIDKQREFCKQILTDMGFSFESLRFEDVAHPCCSTIGPGDYAIGNRYFSNNVFSGISSAIHEGGHALYEIGIASEIADTPLAGGASMGIHESQSRLWENLVGKSKAFWQFYLPKLKAAFPDQLNKIELNDFYGTINYVEPSFIRVESDEVTYNLHIIVRYEIEKALFADDLKVTDLPSVWREKMQEYLTIAPSNDSEGCLQDVHWAWGAFGYFPTYALGNLYASQFYRKAELDLGNITDNLSRGKLQPLREWLAKQIHYSHKAELPHEIIQRVTDESLNPKYFIEYLWKKYGEIYGI